MLGKVSRAFTVLATAATSAPRTAGPLTPTSALAYLAVSSWCVSPTKLEKNFRFDSAAVAARFCAQAEDLRHRAAGHAVLKIGDVTANPQLPSAPALPSNAKEKAVFSVQAVVTAQPPLSGGSFAASPLDNEAATLASAVDDIGAQLQLQGKWG